MSAIDSGSLRFCFDSASSPNERVRTTKDAFANNCSLIDAHADRTTHRMCVLRLERAKLLQGLAEMEQWVVKMVESIPEGLFDLGRLGEEESVLENANGNDGHEDAGEDLNRALVLYTGPQVSWRTFGPCSRLA